VSRHTSDRTPSSSVKCARSPAAGLTVRITAEEQAEELEQSKDQCDVLALGARTLQLECNTKTESLRLADLTIRRLASQPARADTPQGIQSEPPAGFVENNGQLHYFSIPL
jgi:hypothetical protein